jgi:hypothetical protein
MAQPEPAEPRSEQPLYSCVVSIDCLTGQQDEEVLAFGSSAAEAAHQLEELLCRRYDSEQTAELMKQARIEGLAPWCAPGSNS